MRSGTVRQVLWLLLAAGLLGACSRQDNIGSITQYRRGGGDGGGGGGGGGGVGGGATGVITLKALFSGAFLGGGAPAVGSQWPASGAAGVAQTTPIVLLFSKSMDPDTLTGSSFTLADGLSRVPATVAAAVSTAFRVAVLIPNEPLADGTPYTVTLASGVTDLEGQPIALSGSSIFGAQNFSFSFETGPLLPLPESFVVGALYPPPSDQNAAVDTVIQLFFSMPVDADEVESALSVTVLGQPVAGSVDLVVDPRVVQFTPRAEFAPGAEVTVQVAGTLPSLDGTFALNGGFDFSESFTVTSVKAPNRIELRDNEPIVFGPLTYDGRLTTENMENFKADVKVPQSSPEADSVTLLFFQQKQGTSTAARAFTRKQGSGRLKFNVDLSMGDKQSAFVDTGSVDPPQPMFLGAFATRGNINSPVGPVDLPLVWVKTSKPKISFGPPTDPDNRYEFRTVLANPALYGTASEIITNFRAILNATGNPEVFDAIHLSGLAGATDQNLLFFTEPAVGSPGPAEPPPHFLPRPFDEITFEDAIGNQVEVDVKKAGSLHYEGSIGGALEAGAAEALRVRVVKQKNLLPAKNATVTLWKFPYLDGEQPLTTDTTGPSGEVSFSAAQLGASTHLMLTVDKPSCDVFCLAGFENPGLSPAPIGISVVLENTAAAPARIKLKTVDDIPRVNESESFVASASGAGEPAPDEPAFRADERFFTAVLPDTGGSKTFLDLELARPQVMSNLEHDGQDIYVFQHQPIRIFEADEMVDISYANTGVEDVVASFANTVVPKAMITGTGITGDPDDVTVARLVARVPGLLGVLPLSYSPDPLNPGDPVSVVLFAPIPPSLWINELVGDPDPAYELLLQPEAALGTTDPQDTLLEERFRFEIEAADPGSRRLTRQRVKLDFQPTTQAVTDPADPIDLPLIPTVTQSGPTHPPKLSIDLLDGGVPDISLDDSLLRIVVLPDGPGGPNSSDRTWTTLLSGEAAALMSPILFNLPPVDSEPFALPGAFHVDVEAIEFEAADAFDFNRFTFSDIERRHRRLSRAERLEIATIGSP